LLRFPPFAHEIPQQLFKLIKKGEFSFPNPYWAKISVEAKDLVKNLLTVDINKRFKGPDILSHKWIASGQASTEAMGIQHVERLRLLKAKAHLRKMVRVIMAANKLAKALQTFN
jgi:calcium/calmodulin-dependent protein kinase I